MSTNIVQKKIVVMGGANGPSLVLRGLKHYEDFDLTAVIAMTDSGRSSGKIRKEFGQLPSADILRVIIALSPYDYDTLIQILYNARFSSPSLLDGLNIGTALIALAAKETGKLTDIIDQLSNILNAKGKVLPVTLDMSNLVVECSDHTCMFGEGNIDEPSEDRHREVTKAYLSPAAYVTDDAADAIRNADNIIIGPGDLYTSCVASLLPIGVKEAIQESAAKLIYVAGNKYTVGGEPAPKVLSQRVTALEQFLPRPVDIVLYDNHKLSDQEQRYYQKKHWGLIDFDMTSSTEKIVLGEDLELSGGGIDPRKLGTCIINSISA